MNKDSYSISSFQLFFFVVKAQLGVGVITLPASVYLYSKQGAWISVLLSGAICVTLVLMYFVLFKRFDGMNVLEICNLVLGKWMAKFCAVGYLIYYLYASFLVDYSFTATMRRWILLKTPHWIILFLMMLFGIYYGKEKLQNITRFCQLTFWIVILLFFFSFGAYKNVDWDYLFPVQDVKVMGILQGAKASALSFLGFDSILIIFPMVNATLKTKVKTTIVSILFVTFVFLYMTVLCTVYFSPKELEKIIEPTLFLLKTVTLFGIIERLDLIFLSIWVFMIVATYVIYLHLANSVIDHLQKEKERKINLNFLLNFIIYLLAVFVPEIKETADLLFEILSYVSALFVVVIPLFILLFSLISKKKRNGANQT
ncbi:GerAB/ArcD/ProY family transporter [Neobacillus massiliamazoniensis]|uniref:GerKB1 protein n=1 Tax=Neobacillus massiliamazoniensis TaxID=1499688 RepID=A0A0U1NZ46_9BACI|nr:endospore germination permease [Neobacillus massiliamazoniensis]CRK83266.1 GerKB1 protein [Neobacillus massiliamazoniensis]